MHQDERNFPKYDLFHPLWTLFCVEPISQRRDVHSSCFDAKFRREFAAGENFGLSEHSAQLVPAIGANFASKSGALIRMQFRFEL